MCLEAGVILIEEDRERAYRSYRNDRIRQGIKRVKDENGWSVFTSVHTTDDTTGKTSVGAGDPVDFEALCEMLCGGCAQGFEHCRDEERRAALLARRARSSELRRMPFGEYRWSSEWRLRRSRVLLRAGNRCELCHAHRGRLDVHHRTYERYGEEMPGDLIAMCRPYHQRFHDILPDAA